MFKSYILFDCEGYALSDTFYRIEIELLVFRLCPGFFGDHFPSWPLAAHQSEKMNKFYLVT